MVIDVHTHTCRGRWSMGNAITLSPDQLVSRMDKMGVDMAVLLPLESPESFPEYFLTAEALEDWRRFPERLIPFGVIDPRHATNKRQLLEKMVAAGIMGFGEHKNGLAIDDPRSMELYAMAGEFDLPVLLHVDLNLCTDEDGQPGLERVLKAHPNTIFMGHGPAWWAEISADFRRASRIGYPSGQGRPRRQHRTADGGLPQYVFRSLGRIGIQRTLARYRLYPRLHRTELAQAHARHRLPPSLAAAAAGRILARIPHER